MTFEGLTQRECMAHTALDIRSCYRSSIRIFLKEYIVDFGDAWKRLCEANPDKVLDDYDFFHIWETLFE